MERILPWVKEYGILMAVGLVGLGMLGYGLWGQLMPEEATVEIVKGEQKGGDAPESFILVDVAGAVERPGVYKLPSSSRIGDAVVLSGGLSAEADREWVAQTLNLAQEVSDGQKIYIPRQSEDLGGQKISVVEDRSGKININTASLAELDKLPGIGPVRAQAIVANRPYSSAEEIVVKAKVPKSVYEEIKEQISVY